MRPTRAAVPLVALTVLLALAGCGRRGALEYEAGRGPPAPRWATAAPTTEEMLVAPPQAAPERVDDPVRRSEERREDRFEIPPPE